MRRALLAGLAAASFAHAQDARPFITPLSSATAGAAMPAGWKPLTFVNVRERTRYTLVRDADSVVVRADADASASGLAYALQPAATNARMLRWRWKVQTLPHDADTGARSSDDAAARLYVTFEQQPERLGKLERMRYRMLRALYGEVIPHASLVDVWDNRAATGTMRSSPYTDRARVVVMEAGGERLGQWLAYERDVVADYRVAFGEEPPPVSGIALMTDADNTHSRAVAFYGDVSLRSR